MSAEAFQKWGLQYPPSKDQRFWLAAGVATLPLAWFFYSSRRAKTSPQQRQMRDVTSYSSFLKNVEDVAPRVRDVSSFSQFLKKTGGASTTASSGPAVAPKPIGPVLTPDSVPVTVLFGTEFGFSKEIAEKLRDQLLASPVPYWPRLVDMADVAEGLPLSKEQALLCICSTQGDGVPPSEAREFCDWLQSAGAPQAEGCPFSVLALGDRSYAHFCSCGKQLDARLEALGGSRMVDRHDVNREDWKTIDAWLAAVLTGLPELALKTVSELGGYEAELAGSKAVAPPAVRHWGKSRPYHGAVVAIEGLCNVSSADDKNTYRVEIDLGDSSLEYLPGDALGIYPQNAPEAVEELLGAMHASGEMMVPVPSWHYEEPSHQAPRSEMTLQEALTKCYDIRVPKPEILQLLLSVLPGGTPSALKSGDSAGDESHSLPPAPHLVQRLRALIEGDSESYFEARHVLDVLLDFSDAKLPVEKILGALRQLQARLYSISSSQREDASRVQVTVALVRYTSLDRTRIGVTSTYLAERLEVGMHMPIYVSKNPDFRLPADPATPIIMVGPGTGLAPFRSFMQDRIHGARTKYSTSTLDSDSDSPRSIFAALSFAGTAQSCNSINELEPEGSQLSAEAGDASSTDATIGQAVLYFGCRRSDQDYLYGELLESWARDGTLTLFTAFSREKAGKVYVQDRLRESGELVWGLLESGAHFYVCGDAANMAGSVEVALLDIITKHQGLGATDAQAYLDAMSASERYQRDVWY